VIDTLDVTHAHRPEAGSVICPYHDSDHMKRALQTRNVMLVGYGASGVAEERLKEAGGDCAFVRQAGLGGGIDTVHIFRNSTVHCWARLPLA
jgi:hypothetical protein